MVYFFDQLLEIDPVPSYWTKPGVLVLEERLLLLVYQDHFFAVVQPLDDTALETTVGEILLSY